jgi:hypothetical protein
MPRPKSDLKPFRIYLGDADRDRALRIAQRLGLKAAAGTGVGDPDRSAAIRAALAIADEATAKKIRKSAL